MIRNRLDNCPDCGCKVFSLGCVNCDEMNYIDEQIVCYCVWGNDGNENVLIYECRECKLAKYE